jgi:hypothetical protein
MLYREIIAVCSEIHTKHINTLCGQNVEFVNVIPGGTYSDHWSELCINHQFVRRSKHTVCVIKTDKLMLYREIIAVCSEIHIRYRKARCIL